MLLGALLHAGFSKQFLLNELEQLQLPGLHLEINPTVINGISAVKVNVTSSQPQRLRTLPDIQEILEKSHLNSEILEKTLKVFQKLAEAEAKVHNVDIEKVHFHEVGAVDTIVDIVGSIIGLHSLGVRHIICSPLPAGHGFIECEHGILPNPAPATCELLRNIPVYGVNLQQELVTPTGAALLATLADRFDRLPALTIERTGYGAGTQVLTNGQPNVLRLHIGEQLHVTEAQSIEVIETNLDDWSPEGFPYLLDMLFAAGALDVSLTPIHMKKGRPGFKLQVISDPVCSFELKNIILSETSAIGLRYRFENRQTLQRQMVSVTTQWGEIQAKEVNTPAGKVRYPEYEECRKLAEKHRIPLQTVYNEIRNSTR